MFSEERWSVSYSVQKRIRQIPIYHIKLKIFLSQTLIKDYIIYSQRIMKNEIVLFNDGDLNIEVQISPDQETVWLTQKQMGELFDVKQATLSEHINNILESGELDETSIGFSDKSTGGRKPKLYNLDMIISVGYKVNSKRGVVFRKWANSVLKDYMLKGYAINEKRLEALNKTIDIQSRMISSLTETPQDEVYEVVRNYTEALTLLDDYDHQSLNRPEGTDTIYRLSYDECRDLIDSMAFNSDVFGVEKENGKLEGILAAVYQNVFGVEVYPSIEEKAANLLYFLIKDHPFADGCKRIGATIFLEFLNKNNALVKDGKQIISNSALVAITLMVAESRPEEKEIMITLIMNFLSRR